MDRRKQRVRDASRRLQKGTKRKDKQETKTEGLAGEARVGVGRELKK